MQEKPQKKNKSETENRDEPEIWEKDQKERGYYYDDAHGYEVFDPEGDDAEGEDGGVSINEPC
jgi:hypothetical protein